MREAHRHIFDLAIRTANMLVKMFPSRCEVAVHDFSDLEKSLIHISGKITERKIASPITDLVLQELKKPHESVEDIPNYKTQSKTGIVMKSSTIFLRAEEGNIIGALCINFDISLLVLLGGEIQDFITFDETQKKSESFFTSVYDVIQGMVEQVLLGFKKTPSLMTMEEKIECVRLLEEKGAFLIKGATEYVANELSVSKFTIYNYLQKIRSQNEFNYEEEQKK